MKQRVHKKADISADFAVAKDRGESPAEMEPLLPLFVHRQSQQIRIGHLLMTDQLLGEGLQGIYQTDFIGPESVRWMCEVGP
jgi:hypothetical protein